MARPARRCRVDALSDDDPQDNVVLSGGEDALPEEERTVAVESVLASLRRRRCSCSVQKRRRRLRHGVAACCLDTLQELGLLQRLIDQRLRWQQLHKLDQDRLLFDVLRLLFIEQGAPMTRERPQASPPNVPIHKLSYTVLGQPVCRGGFMLLWGVGSTRFRAILNAVAEGNSSPPVDLRYLKKVRSRSAHVLSWITSFLEELYESEAETLPDGLNDVDCEWWEDVLGETSL